MMRGRKGHRYDIDELLVAADMAFCWRGDFNICDAEKAGESVGEDGVSLELGGGDLAGYPLYRSCSI